MMVKKTSGTIQQGAFFTYQKTYIDKSEEWDYYSSGISHDFTGGGFMAVTVRTYDAKIDSKKRITLRNALFEYFHVKEYDDGRILLEPRELTAPFQVSAQSLAMMDASINNLKAGKVSEAIDLSEFED